MFTSDIKRQIAASLRRLEIGGVIQNSEAISDLKREIGPVFLAGYASLLQSLPLAGAELLLQLYPQEDDFDGTEEICFADVPLLLELNKECYPGIYLNPNNFFVFAYGGSGAGNCFAFNVMDQSDPAVYEVWHDAAHSVEGMAKALNELTGVNRVASHFSHLFSKALHE